MNTKTTNSGEKAHQADLGVLTQAVVPPHPRIGPLQEETAQVGRLGESASNAARRRGQVGRAAIRPDREAPTSTFAAAALLLASCDRPTPEPVAPTDAPEAPGPAPAPTTPPLGETGRTADTSEDTTTRPTADTSSPRDTATAPPRWVAYVGAADGRIHVFSVDASTGSFTPAGAFPAGQDPSFLAFAPDLRLLVAVDERADELASFAIDRATGALAPIDRVSSGGRGPAHVAVDATGTVALAANYGSGEVVMVRLEPGGTFGPTLADLPTGENAHQVAVAPGNTSAFVPNLGSDTVSQLVLDPAAGRLTPNEVPTVATAPGSGPRHLAFAPAAPYAWLIAELGDTVTALAFDRASGRLTPIETWPTLPAGVDGSGNACGEIAVSPDGRFLYGSNRGHDSIATWAILADGRLEARGHTPTGGSWPRHFSLSPDGAWLFVANQRSDEVVTFRVDRATGALSEQATTPLPAAPGFVEVVDLGSGG